MSHLENVAVVPPPPGRRGKQCNFLFQKESRGGVRSIRVTPLAELRQRNKMACARAPMVLDDKSDPSTRDNSKQIAAREKKSAKKDKLFRHRKNENFRCFLTIPDVVKIEIQASCQLTVEEIKLKMLVEARKTLRTLSKAGKIDNNQCNELLKEAGDYSLKVVGLHEYLSNKSLPLQRVLFIQVCSKAYITPQFEMVPKSTVEETGEDARKLRIKNELSLGMHIASLVGSAELSNFLTFENDEIADFRRSAIQLKEDLMEKKKVRMENCSDLGDPRIQSLPEYLFGEPMPSSLVEKLQLIARYPIEDEGQSSDTTLLVNPVSNASALRDEIFGKYKRKMGDLVDKTSMDYILKVVGYQDYLYGDSQLISYDYIRRCIGKGESIYVHLIPLSQMEDTLIEVTKNNDSIVDKLLALEEDTSKQTELIEVFKVDKKFEIFVNSVERALPASSDLIAEDCFLFIKAELYHAGCPLGKATTMHVPACSDPQWNEKIIFPDVLVKNIPLGSRILFTLVHRVKKKDIVDTIISWVGTQMYDHKHIFKNGMTNLRMWIDSKPSPVGSCYQNLLQMNIPICFIDFCGLYEDQNIFYPEVTGLPEDEQMMNISDHKKARIVSLLGKATDTNLLASIIDADPLTELNSEDKTKLWNFRHTIKSDKAALSKFLLSIRWGVTTTVQEAHKMLKVWNRPTPLQALELLDAKFADPVIRDYGVSCLSFMSDGEVYDFLLQLTQVLKHEPYHNSALSKFLLRRAWTNPKIGHALYWHLKAEMHIADIAERYTILLDSFLRGCGPQLYDLLKQNDVNLQLVHVAKQVKETSGSERKTVLAAGLKKLKLPGSFQLPLDLRVKVDRLFVEKCKYMDSKKLPLWLVWDNIDRGKTVSVIFKVGDDLRQDVLTLQMIRIFDKLWKKEGLDLLLKPYGCIATGDDIGMIEVVGNADTTANINKDAGGTKAVLKEDTLTKWLKKHNEGFDYEKIQETFALSCAGYCVATFVLGIGDRHNDNIMLTKQGNLFHIDFGHFLGNYKKKYGIKRERAPFIFTPQYAHVLDGKNGKHFGLFMETCCKAFNILRHNRDLFITLFQMMLCTGIPELASAGDIEYLRNAFAIGMSDDEAAAYFKKLIFSSLGTKTTIINDAIHVFVHR